MLRRQIQIQLQSEADDGAGGTTATWTTDATIRADVKQVDAKRIFENQKDFDKNVYRIVYRTGEYNSLSKHKNRIVYNGIIMHIHTVKNPTEDKTFTKVIAVDA